MSCDAALFCGLFGLLLGIVAVIASITDRRHRRRT
jgi:hypothetical protein